MRVLRGSIRTQIVKSFLFFCAFTLILCYSYSQSTPLRFIDSINAINANSLLSDKQNLAKLYNLERQAGLPRERTDTVYAAILLNVGKFEYRSNSNYPLAIEYTLASLQANSGKSPKRSARLAMLAYYNIGYYYNMLLLYEKSLQFFDSAVFVAKALKDTIQIVYARLWQTGLLFRLGDYQKCVEESIDGISYSLAIHDTANYLSFLISKAQSLCYQNNATEALREAEHVLLLSTRLQVVFEQANALKITAFANSKLHQFSTAVSFYEQSIKRRIPTKLYSQIALDYIDFGNFLLDSLGNYSLAKFQYKKAIYYAEKERDSLILSKANINLSEVSFLQKQLKTAAVYYLEAAKYLRIDKGNNILITGPVSEFNLVGDKDLAVTLLMNKTKLLLQLYNQTKQQAYLSACLSTAQAADSLIVNIRHEQTGEHSKLYWRDYTRVFFTNCMEACYLASDTRLAFFFMEKSRAVLLNDKLNEIGAAAYLPAVEIKKEDSLRMKVLLQQQNLTQLDAASAAYKTQELKLVQSEEDFEHYIKALEKTYPVYYQYKYADDVPALKTVQQFLTNNKQNFVHYFINDTVMYVLAVTANSTKIIKVKKDALQAADLIHFLSLCSDRQALNTHYNTFTTLSYKIYQSLFLPLQLPKGRVVICADNYLIPFEALTANENGEQLLINDYTFSYVYAARYLMGKPNVNIAGKNFLGIAPIAFSPYLNLPDLTQSANALTASSAHYSGVTLLTKTDASSNNFLQQLPNYTVVNIFSHASAASSDVEPLLYLQDSAIRLSQLQLIHMPATKLVVLSACETYAGKRYTGEGIYSLARGFASAGIPAVAATLWNADEDATYAITNLFNKHLTEGLDKDEALRQAKLAYLESNSGEKRLPFFWANMILVGDTEPVKLISPNHAWWWITGATLLCLATTMLIGKLRPNQKSKQ